MSDVVLAAIAAAAGGIVVAIINMVFGRKNTKADDLKALCAAQEINQAELKRQLEEMRSEQREFRAVTLHRIEQLDKKQDKHNNLVERMVVVEQSTKSAHHRISGLEASK